MPKIIKNIEQKIFNAAFELFGTEGYRGVDMKSIAQKAGIGVGTLYNYYPNKKELFLSVLESSWEDTILKVSQNLSPKYSARENIKKFVEVYYGEIEKRKGMGKVVTREKDFKNHRDFFKKVQKRLADVLFKNIHAGLDDNILMEDTRLGDALAVVVNMNADLYPDEKERNIEFLYYLLCKILLKSNQIAKL